MSREDFFMELCTHRTEGLQNQGVGRFRAQCLRVLVERLFFSGSVGCEIEKCFK